MNIRPVTNGDIKSFICPSAKYVAITLKPTRGQIRKGKSKPYNRIKFIDSLCILKPILVFSIAGAACSSPETVFRLCSLLVSHPGHYFRCTMIVPDTLLFIVSSSGSRG